jgi:hypothetical protein
MDVPEQELGVNLCYSDQLVTSVVDFALFSLQSTWATLCMTKAEG